MGGFESENFLMGSVSPATSDFDPEKTDETDFQADRKKDVIMEKVSNYVRSITLIFTIFSW